MEASMRRKPDNTTVTISPFFRVVILRKIRGIAGLRPGDRLDVSARGGVIEMVRLEPIRNLRGFLKGIDTSVRRGRR
jgi:bifunctional DNA-binding transcriptional regulator/antitoxin component of YhaV-PrlF toxin-antitoxin module